MDSPQSAQITAGQGGTIIVVKMGPHSGNVTVKANSACGTSTASVLPITVLDCFAGAEIYTMNEVRPVPEVISNYGGTANSGKLNLEWDAG